MENTGYCNHAKVEQLGRMNITGNVIPMNWYQTIRKENGKPDQTAITLLAEIVYWYRPTEIRDEVSGQFLGLRKKFHDDQYLQKSYKDLADTFGFGYQEVQRAVKRLEDLGAIKRIVRHLRLKTEKTQTVLYIDIIPERIAELTFNKSEDKNDPPNNRVPIPVEPEAAEEPSNMKPEVDSPSRRGEPIKATREPSMGIIKTDGTPYTERGGVSSNTMPPPITSNSLPLSGVIGHIHRLHTKNTRAISSSSEGTTRVSGGSQSRKMMTMIDSQKDKPEVLSSQNGTKIRNKVKEVIRRNIEYDILILNEDPEHVGEIVEVMVDIICSNQKTIRVNGTPMNTEVTKSQFMKLTSRHIECVLHNLRQVSHKITNFKAYLVSSLYNASLSLKLNEQAISNHEKQKYCAFKTP